MYDFKSTSAMIIGLKQRQKSSAARWVGHVPVGASGASSSRATAGGAGSVNGDGGDLVFREAFRLGLWVWWWEWRALAMILGGGTVFYFLAVLRKPFSFILVWTTHSTRKVTLVAWSQSWGPWDDGLRWAAMARPAKAVAFRSIFV
ncbi:hypothetical protein BDY19DRAFT_902631 [Irpex rosettiformis]|uniref:Uncharacterized protein n=1 Tax=Irpex rosettiformis TaxID=378272 RepID=A0ACB8UHT9_9APHY|nr:hypothetical protein BDY19DRAFT_902631 [Irpex rosettiformis]